MKEFFSPEVIWFVVGAILLVAEFATPGFVIIFFGAGAWVTALAAWILPCGVNCQLTIFLLSSIISLLLLRNKLKEIFSGKESGHHSAVDVDDGIIGHKAEVVETIKPGVGGQIELNGTHWKALCDTEIAKGEVVEIVKKDSITLHVKPHNEGE